ncbi:MAG TPA: hypothetical protein VKT80_13975, partial [Chloroflexota bacterium]|nr:hypothetical protein [Chloroflexota bacterium]
VALGGTVVATAGSGDLVGAGAAVATAAGPRAIVTVGAEVGIGAAGAVGVRLEVATIVVADGAGSVEVGC